MKFRLNTDLTKTKNLMHDLERAKNLEQEKKAIIALLKDVDKRLTDIENYIVN